MLGEDDKGAGVTTSRERILEASTTLLRRQGLSGTGIN